VVTPRADNKIILFVTEEKQASLEQYSDRLVAPILHWEGPNDHFAEQRMVNAADSGDEIHLFYRRRHHSEFTYFGRISVGNYKLVRASWSLRLCEVRFRAALRT
jgi:putative restriction endonuclease